MYNKIYTYNNGSNTVVIDATNKHFIKTDILNSLANAIRGRKNTSQDPMYINQMASNINKIEGVKTFYGGGGGLTYNLYEGDATRNLYQLGYSSSAENGRCLDDVFYKDYSVYPQFHDTSPNKFKKFVYFNEHVNVGGSAFNTKVVNLFMQNGMRVVTNGLLGPASFRASSFDDSMDHMFLNIESFVGPAISPEQVKYMSSTYRNCYNMVSNPVCGNKVDSLFSTYENCYNLIGSPVIGPNVTIAARAYFGCNNITGLPVLGSSKCYNYAGTYAYCTGFTRPAPDSDIPLNRWGVYDGMYMGCTNLVGDPILYSTENKGYSILRNMYNGCTNLNGNAPELFYEVNLHSDGNAGGYPLDDVFRDCTNLKGNGLITGLKLQNASSTNVLNVLNTFRNCTNLNGYARVSGPVQVASFVFYNCNNLIGPAIIDSTASTVTIDSIFEGCTKLGGTVILPNNTKRAMSAFRNCDNMDTIIFYGAMTRANMANFINRSNYDKRLNVIFATNTVLNNARDASVTGCTLTAIAAKDETINCPWIDYNGNIYAYTELNVKRSCYNEAHNLYMYSMA